MLVIGQDYSGGVDFPTSCIVVDVNAIIPLITTRTHILGALSQNYKFGEYESETRAKEVFKELYKAYESRQSIFIMPAE